MKNNQSEPVLDVKLLNELFEKEKPVNKIKESVPNKNVTLATKPAEKTA